MHKLSRLLPLFLVLVFGFVFFYRLGSFTLYDWDEAWYADIARNMVISSDYMNMRGLGMRYSDHPPLGFWLMAGSYKLFGINELTTRLPSAALGLGSIYLIYLIGKLLFKRRSIGFAAAIVLGTSVWYTMRVRSGNLDSPWIFFNLGLVYYAIKARHNFRYFPLAMLFFAALFMTKTLVGSFAIFLVLLPNLRQLINIKKNWQSMLLGLLLFAALVVPWYHLNIATDPGFLYHHFGQIGTRSASLASFLRLRPELPLFYLHMGIRKWYYIWIISLFYLALTLKIFKKNVAYIIFWQLIVFYPFLTSEFTEIWHLIPVYLPISLTIAYAVYDGLKRALKLTSRFFRLPATVYLLFYLVIFSSSGFIQLKNMWKEIIPANPGYIPDEVDIATQAQELAGTLYLDYNWGPRASFYSGRPAGGLGFLPDDGHRLRNLYINRTGPFQVITNPNNLVDLDSNQINYQLISRNNSFVLLGKDAE